MKDNHWVKAGDLAIGQDIKIGINPPLVNHLKDMKECDHWQLGGEKFNGYTFRTDTMEEYLRTLAFARVLGLVITDGTVPLEGSVQICIGHLMDVRSFFDDLDQIYNHSKRHPKYRLCTSDQGSSVYNFAISIGISRFIRKLEGIT